MYTRYHVWQEPSIASASENLWENIIVTKFPAVDIRLLLKGYGWKPHPTDENLVILYEGRYEVYYKEVSAPTWIRFATVVSERASTNVGYVYEDTSVALGLSPEKTYAIKIVAVDGEKFANWPGTIEGISSGAVFYTDMRMRMARPVEVYVLGDVSVRENVILGKSVFDLSCYDLIFSVDIPVLQGHSNLFVAEGLSIFEYTRWNVNLIIGDQNNVYDWLNGIVEWTNFGFTGDWNMYQPVDIVSVDEDVALEPYPYGAIGVDEIAVEENLVIANSEIFSDVIYTDINIADFAVLGFPVFDLPLAYEDILADDVIDFIATEPPYIIRIMNENADDVGAITDEFITSHPYGGIIFEPQISDPLNDATSFTNKSVGAGAVTDNGSELILTSVSPSDYAWCDKDFNVTFAKILYFEFKMKFVYNGLSGTKTLLMSLGGSIKRVGFTIAEVVGDYNIGDLKSAKNRWMKVQVVAYQNFRRGNVTGQWTYCPVRLDDITAPEVSPYYTQSYITDPASGHLQFYTASNNNEVRVKDLVIGKFSADNGLYHWHEEDLITITESKTLVVV